jgi:hypothetical protein
MIQTPGLEDGPAQAGQWVRQPRRDPNKEEI